MKKTYLTLIAILFAINFSYAQNTYPWPSSGDVGIGTTSPGKTLDVIGTVKATSFNVKGATANEVSALTGTGMGYSPTSYPVAAFGIITGSGVTSIGYNPLTNSGGSFSGDGSEVLFRNIVKFIQPNTGGTDFLSPTITLNNGNVGIGTTTPDQLLSVNGNIHAQEVLVNLTGFEDRVFKRSYHLSTLPEVKAYIDKNHHLPDVPSEAEVMKDGLKVGDMERVLTKKVEELTLYLIEKEKQLKTQQQQIDALSARLDAVLQVKTTARANVKAITKKKIHNL